MAEKTYMDIGHGDRNAVLWLYEDDKVRSYVAGDDTHATIWGIDAMNCWRGRLDPITRDVFAVSPVLHNGSMPSQQMLERLKDKFGATMRVFVFHTHNKTGTEIL